jgi:hypothetical protein
MDRSLMPASRWVSMAMALCKVAKLIMAKGARMVHLLLRKGKVEQPVGQMATLLGLTGRTVRVMMLFFCRTLSLSKRDLSCPRRN